MIKQIRLLTHIQLCNFFGINVARFSKDKKKKRQIYLVIFAFGYMMLLMMMYSVSMCSGLIAGGNIQLVPSTLGISVSAMMFLFTVFRAGLVLFNRGSYEAMAALPVKTESIVISRFMLLYAVDVIYSIVITVTGAIACSVFAEVSAVFIASMLIGGFILPLVPMTLAMLVGTAVYGFTSRVKKRNLGGIIRTLLLVLFMIGYFAVINGIGGNMTDIMNKAATSMSAVSEYYIPVLWFGRGAQGSFLYLLMFIILSLAIFGLTVFVVSRFFVKISTALSSEVSGGAFTLRAQKNSSAFSALFRKELKRYFSSSIYVSNTLVGYIFAVLGAAAIAFAGEETILAVLPVEKDVVLKCIPIMIALVCNLSPTTTSAISMEGKNWEFTKSLPVSGRDLVNSKLALNLIFAVPAMILSIVILATGLNYTPLQALVAFIPAIGITLFLTVMGLYLNVKMPDFSWENEAVPVKQSKCVLIASMMSFLIPGGAFALMLLTSGSVVTSAVLILVFAIATFLLYNKLVKTELYIID